MPPPSIAALQSPREPQPWTNTNPFHTEDEDQMLSPYLILADALQGAGDSCPLTSDYAEPDKNLPMQVNITRSHTSSLAVNVNQFAM
jgi:hypothetical protein